MDITFGLGYIPKEKDYTRVAGIQKARALAMAVSFPFDYPI